MRRCQPTLSSSSSEDDSDGSDIESCFDIEETDADADTDIEGGDYDEEDLPDLEWIAREDNAYPPEYYLDQENSDESEDEDEDYSDNSILLLDMIEDQFHRCTTNMCKRIPPGKCKPSVAALLSPSSNGC